MPRKPKKPKKEQRFARRTVRVDDETWAAIDKLKARLKAQRGKQVTAGDVIRRAVTIFELEMGDD